MKDLKFFGGLDVNFLYQLLKQRPKCERISHKKMPSYSEHYWFVASMPYKEWWTIAYKGVSCGSIYLSEVNEIGVHLLKEFHHKGIEAAAIRWMASRHKNKRLICNVGINDKSRKYIMDMIPGWRKVQVTYALRG